MTKQIKLSHSSNEDWLAKEQWKGVPNAREWGEHRGTQHTCWKTQVLPCPQLRWQGIVTSCSEAYVQAGRKKRNAPFPATFKRLFTACFTAVAEVHEPESARRARGWCAVAGRRGDALHCSPVRRWHRVLAGGGWGTFGSWRGSPIGSCFLEKGLLSSVTAHTATPKRQGR